MENYISGEAIRLKIAQLEAYAREHPVDSLMMVAMHDTDTSCDVETMCLGSIMDMMRAALSLLEVAHHHAQAEAEADDPLRCLLAAVIEPLQGVFGTAPIQPGHAPSMN